MANVCNLAGCGCNSFIAGILENAGRRLWQYQNFLKLSMASSELLDPISSFAASESSSKPPDLSSSFAATTSGLAVSAETPTTDDSSDGNAVGDGNFPADTIYFGGPIVTMVADDDRVEAIAVKAGKIVAAGSEAEVMELKGYNTGMVNLNGKCLMPGFIDPHSHVMLQSAKFFTANLDPFPIGTVKSIIQKEGDEAYPELSIQGQLRKYIADHNPARGSLIIGWGYDDSYAEEDRHPFKEDLDAVSTEYPILVVHISNHLVACNSALLQKANITAATPDPEGGKIQRDKNGEPNGVLEETALLLLAPYLPQVSSSQAMEMLKQGLAYYAAAGITTAQDGATSLGGKTLLEEMDRLGKLPIDVVSYFSYAGLEEADLDEIPGVYSNTHDPGRRFRVGGVKLVVDGSIQGYTAFLTEPYYSELLPTTKPVPDKCLDIATEQMFLGTKINSDASTDNFLTTDSSGDGDELYRGYPSMDQAMVTKWIQDCDARNIQLLVHTNGDAATDILLASIEAVRDLDSLCDLRTTIIHAQTIREDQLDEVATYGLIPSFFPVHIPFWGLRHQTRFLGPDRAARISPAQSALKRGIKFTLHHDAPIAGISMLAVASASVNRIPYDQENEPLPVLGEDQKITPFQALRAITADAAWQYFEEDHKGTLEIGKRADLVILSEDPLKVGQEQPLAMKDIEVLATVKDGQPIYSHPESPISPV